MGRPQYRTPAYRAFKAALAETDTPCWWCGVRRATTPDHNPPVSLGGGDGDLVPACMHCQSSRGGKLSGSMRRARREHRRSLLRPWPDQP